MEQLKPHEFLGVKENASLSEIQEAYLLKVKIFHPDRFDQKLQPNEWAEANRLLRKLNDARDQLIRKIEKANKSRQMDEENTTATTKSNEQQKSSEDNSTSGEPHDTEHYESYEENYFDLSTIKQNGIKFSEASSNLAADIIRWRKLKGDNKITIGDSKLAITILVACVAISYATSLSLASNSIVDTSFVIRLCLNFMTISIGCHCALMIYQDKFSTIGSFALIFPLYFTVVRYGTIEYRPTWLVSSISAEKITLLGLHIVTFMRVKFHDNVTIRVIVEKQHIDKFIEYWGYTNIKLAEVTAKNDFKFFKKCYIFTEKVNLHAKAVLYNIFWYNFGPSLFALTLALYILYTPQPPQLKTVARSIPAVDKTSTYNPGTTKLFPELQYKPENIKPPIAEPKPLPMPVTGYVGDYYYESENTAPLSIQTPNDERGYFFKVLRLGGGTVVKFFINGSSKFVANVPFGIYKIRYATGTTWYGQNLLFGDDTTRKEFESSFTFNSEVSGEYLKSVGHEIVMVKSPRGNLNDKQISKDDF